MSSHDPTSVRRLAALHAVQRSIDGRVKHRRNCQADSKSVWFTRPSAYARRKAN